MARTGRPSKRTPGDHAGRWWNRSLFGTSLGRVAVACVALVVATELVVRYIEPALPPTGLSEPTVKAGDLDRLAAGGTLDTVIIGASDAEAAINPEQLQSTAPGLGDVYNASLKGMVPSTYTRWVRDVLLDAGTPSRVIVSFAPYFLLSPDLIAVGSAQETQAATVDQAISGRTFVGRLTNHSAIARRRAVLRNPVAAVSALFRRANGQLAPTFTATMQRGNIRSDGWDTSYSNTDRVADLEAGLAAVETPSLSMQRRLERVAQSPAEMGVNGEVLTRLVRGLRSRSIEVTVVVLPYPHWIPNVFGDLHSAIRIERDLVMEAGGNFVDLTDLSIPLSEYSDINHLGPQGAEVVTAQLAERMDMPGE